jgi:hypothetical protein
MRRNAARPQLDRVTGKATCEGFGPGLGSATLGTGGRGVAGGARVTQLKKPC